MQKKWITRTLILAALVGCGIKVRSCNQTMRARYALDHEINKYYQEASSHAGWIAFQFARPYLDDETRGRYQQRLESLASPGLTIGFHAASDSYGSIIFALAFAEFDRWAESKLRREGCDPNDRAAQQELIATTPRAKILELHRAVQKLQFLSYRCDGEDAPDSLESVATLRAEFETEKRAVEALLEARRQERQR